MNVRQNQKYVVYSILDLRFNILICGSFLTLLGHVFSAGQFFVCLQSPYRNNDNYNLYTAYKFAPLCGEKLHSCMKNKNATGRFLGQPHPISAVPVFAQLSEKGKIM